MIRPIRAGGHRYLIGILAPALLLCSTVKLASSADLNQLSREVAELEQLARSLAIRYKAESGNTDQLAEHRLVDAQVLYNLRDYGRAAILLFDYISKYKNTRGFTEALFFLADSLYKKRDHLSSRRYFEKVADRGAGQFYQGSLQRLIELSLQTGDSSQVPRYLKALESIPKEKLKSSVSYVKGKYYYFQNNTAAAKVAFAEIRPDKAYYMQSRYFAGAIAVRDKDYAEAAKTFQELLKVQPKKAEERHLRELTHLALGRLLYQKGKISEAIEQYQKISRRSKEFATALYEISWAYIKANEFQRAHRALDLLILAKPKSPLLPRVRVLQGNLLIRLKAWSKATNLFTKTREEFIPVHKRMAQVLKEQQDPGLFFDLLLTRNLEELAINVQVPDVAISWVKENPEVKRAVDLITDLRDIEKSLKEITDLLKRLDRAINSPAKIKIFPEFASAKARTLEVENRLTLARNQIIAKESALVAQIASADERSRLADLQRQRKQLDEAVRQLPTRATSYKKREKRTTGYLGTLSKSLSELGVMIDAQKAQLVATEKYFEDTNKNRTRARSFKRDASKMTAELKALRADLVQAQTLLATAQDSVGVGGAQEIEERRLKTKHKALVAQQHLTLTGLRARLQGSALVSFDKLVALHARCDGIDTSLHGFGAKLEAGIERRLANVRVALEEERAQLTQYFGVALQYRKQSDSVAGGITHDGFQKVARRFYEIVVRADVGIIDVAWALKDAKSKEVSRLVREQKRELKLVDDEFREVLQEE
jgi:TolA-binding protein